MKKLICALLPLLLCAVLLTVPAAAEFTDVKPEDWFASDVAKAVETGLVNGRTETTFCPDEQLTYAEAVKLAACMHQKNADGKVTLANGDPWYQSYVDYAKEKGILSKDYSWNEPATRADYMAIFAHALPDASLAAKNEVPDGSVPDVPADHPAAAEIYKLYRAGVLQGSDAQFSCRPADPIKRSEVAAVLTRMMFPEERLSFTTVAGPIARAYDYVGLWDDQTSQRAHLTILPGEEYGEYTMAIHWGDSASSAGEWTMKAVYDEKTGRMNYKNGEMAYVTYGNDGAVVSREVKWNDAEGYFLLNEQGVLAWKDSREERSAGFRLTRTQVAVPTAEEFALWYFRAIAGSPEVEFNAPAAAVDAVKNAYDKQLWTVNVPAMRKTMLTAWNSLTADEQHRFDANFMEVVRLIDACEDNWEENSQKFFLIGAVDEMKALLENPAARLSWSVLSSNTLTMGNSDGSDEAGVNGDSFVGTWVAGRASLVIKPDGDGYSCSILWASSAAEVSRWEYHCLFDGMNLSSFETGVRTDEVYGTDGKVASSKTVFSDGAASFSIDDDGKLTWIDYKEYPSNPNGLLFEKVEIITFAPDAATIADGFFRMLGSGYHQGTAGSTLAQAQTAVKAVSFADEQKIAEADFGTLRTNVLTAWESLTAEEQSAFDENFVPICELIDSCVADWESAKGPFEDCGVAEAMTALLRNETARTSWSVLVGTVLTMGNSDGN